MNRIRANLKLVVVLVAVAMICLSTVYFLFTAEGGSPGQTRLTSNPTLVSPINSIAVQSTPELVWTHVKAASTYELEVIREKPLKVVCSKKGLPPNPSYRFQGSESLLPGTYHWRVRAVNAAGTPGPWSETGIFKVQ